MITLLKVSPYTGDILAWSPNHGTRKSLAIEGIVLHATADDGDEAGSLKWMRSPRSQVSCHLFVGRAGRVTRLVGDQQRAWHAGLSWWRGTSDVNSITLGIEIANRNDGEPYTDAQYHRVAEIVAHYCRQGISLDDVVGHEQIAAGRRTDPLGWDWERFRAMVQQRLRSLDDESPLIAMTQSPEPIKPALRSAIMAALGSADAVPKQNTPAAPRQLPPPAAKKETTPGRTTPKYVLRSRIVWLNGLTVLVLGGLLASDAFDLVHRMDLPIDIPIPANIAKWAMLIIGLLNILLRLRTSQPIVCTLTGQCPQKEPQLDRPSERQIMAMDRRRQQRGEAVYAARTRRGNRAALG